MIIWPFTTCGSEGESDFSCQNFINFCLVNIMLISTHDTDVQIQWRWVFFCLNRFTTVRQLLLVGEGENSFSFCSSNKREICCYPKGKRDEKEIGQPQIAFMCGSLWIYLTTITFGRYFLFQDNIFTLNWLELCSFCCFCCFRQEWL